MCGITGIISKKGEISSEIKAIVGKMNDALVHRGPDDDGYFTDHRCSLAMRRLSIIDLSGGKQPIFNENRSVLAFQNGEIYNYRQLKTLLESKGHYFTSNSDTEVLVHMYEEFGESMFGQLEGMFAICIYDLTRGLQLIARDRYGEKPLYFSSDSVSVSFSSEIASLLENPNIERTLNREALPYFLRTSLVPEPLTLFKRVKILPAGHVLKIHDGVESINSYHEFDYSVNPDISRIDDAVSYLKPLLVGAVQKQLVSDVPVGAFLSGGIDSSTMVALMQNESPKPISTFNVRFEDQEYDESTIAKKVALLCGTDHHEITVPNQQFSEDIFWKIIDHIGQPFRDSSAIPSFFVSKEIGQHVKVAISGDGGDEIFGGYDIFNWYRKILSLKHSSGFAIGPLSAAISGISNFSALKNNSRIRQLNRAFSTAKLEEREIAISLNEMFSQNEVGSLFEGEPGSLSLELLKSYPEAYHEWSSLRRIMYYRTKHTLTANMLVKIDRMSMANSLEVRAPFLDPALGKAAAQLPDHLLMKNGVGKLLLREILKDQLPKEVFNHPKQGFNLPLYKYQNQQYQSLAHQLLIDENPLPDLFNKDMLKEILKRGIGPEKDLSQLSTFRASHQLWMLMQFLGWAKRFKVSIN